MEEFDVLLTAISRVNMEIARTKTVRVRYQKMGQKKDIFPQY